MFWICSFFGGLLNMFFLSVGWILGYAIFRQTGFPCFKIVGWLTLCVQQTCCARSGEKLQNFWRAAHGGPTDTSKPIRLGCHQWIPKKFSGHDATCWNIGCGHSPSNFHDPNWEIDTTKIPWWIPSYSSAAISLCLQGEPPKLGFLQSTLCWFSNLQKTFVFAAQMPIFVVPAQHCFFGPCLSRQNRYLAVKSC